MKVEVVNSVTIKHTPRLMQLRGMFDMVSTPTSEFRRTFDLPLHERGWQIGLIMGPSGSGKTSILRKVWPESQDEWCEWSSEKSVLDEFPKTMGIKEVVQLLSAVGFSSPPSWQRPFHCLSNGEQFRVTLARQLARGNSVTVIDEFTSVVDRTVAQIASAAVAKMVRRDLASTGRAVGGGFVPLRYLGVVATGLDLGHTHRRVRLEVTSTTPTDQPHDHQRE